MIAFMGSTVMSVRLVMTGWLASPNEEFKVEGSMHHALATLLLFCCSNGLGGANWGSGSGALPELPPDNGEKPISVLIEEQQVLVPALPMPSCPFVWMAASVVNGAGDHCRPCQLMCNYIIGSCLDGTASLPGLLCQQKCFGCCSTRLLPETVREQCY